MKKLPIGIQYFKEIMEGDYIYADKTEYIYNLIQRAKYYFLSRPRRFGKSLLLDTISEVYSGDKELFKGLRIYDTGYDFKKHPVIRLDMSNISTENPDVLKESMLTCLRQKASDENVDIDSKIPSDVFKLLIIELSKKYNERVVVLIDEYDKPILDRISDMKTAKNNRDMLKGFYGILKSMDPYLRFTMLTGVSKFTKTSVFSELNNLTDITLAKKYANICGFTIDDFDRLFGEHIKHLSTVEEMEHCNDIRSEILNWYDGYSWDGRTRVLNPFSLLSFFEREGFENFWYNSGTPGFLVDLIKKNPEEYANINSIEITEHMLNSGDLDRISVGPLMFQSGYLTVNTVDYTQGAAVYSLCMPNNEVKDAFNMHVLSRLTDNNDVKTRTLSIDLRKALRSGNMQKALEALRRLFGSIPYQIHISHEYYYHSIIYALMSFTGLDADAEVSVSDGRVDVVMEYDDKIYVMEFKYEECEKDASAEVKRKLFDKALNEGMEQIDNKGYCKPYIGGSKTIYKAAFAFLGRSDIEMRYDLIEVD